MYTYIYIYIYIILYIYIYTYTYIYVVRQGGCDYWFVYTYVLLLSLAWDHVGSQDKMRKHAERLKLKSKSYFIWARKPQRHASSLRNLQGLNPEVLEYYNGNCPYFEHVHATHLPATDESTLHGPQSCMRERAPDKQQGQEGPFREWNPGLGAPEVTATGTR